MPPEDDGCEAIDYLPYSILPGKDPNYREQCVPYTDNVQESSIPKERAYLEDIQANRVGDDIADSSTLRAV